MPLPQGYLPRQGDVLVLHAVVKYDVTPEDKTQVFVRPIGHYSDCRIPMNDIVGLHARAWEAGEEARLSGYTVTVIAVDGDQAWVKHETGNRETVHVNALDTAPDHKPFGTHDEPEPPAKPLLAPVNDEIDI